MSMMFSTDELAFLKTFLTVHFCMFITVYKLATVQNTFHRLAKGHTGLECARADSGSAPGSEPGFTQSDLIIFC